MSGEGESAESKYEVREVIGKGAFGEVNLVVEKQSKQRYVLKRIKMARQSEWQRRATRQEIEIVSRLRHPFIMPYKEHWIHHGHTINVVYGYCEKGDLTSAITKQRGKLFPEETLRLWLAQLLLAVDYMHRQNVLHRDIKTQNILLTGDGDVQIGDFGLSTVRVPSAEELQKQQERLASVASGVDDSAYSRADSVPSILFDTTDGIVLGGGDPGTPDPSIKGGYHGAHVQQPYHNPGAGQEAYVNALENAHHANGHNGQGHAGEKDKEQPHAMTPVHDPKAGTRNDYALVGTPHFMSPELLSSQKYSYETDIWSLGVVMYELTTLKPPFNAFNLAGLVAKIKRAALPPIPANYSADWSSILKNMLRKDPGRRASPMELLALPSMRSAVQQAIQRALTISSDFPIPNIPFPPSTEGDGTPGGGFCFDITAGANNGRTPSAGGAAITPVLVHANPQGMPMGIVSSTYDQEFTTESLLETESSPLSKFPDLAATSSPLPTTKPAPASENDPRISAPSMAAAAAAAEARRSKTPAVARRAGTTAGGAAPGAKCLASPLRTRPGAAQQQPAAATVAGRSKTPGRPLLGAAAPAAKADDAGGGGVASSRLVRKPVGAKETAAPSTRIGAAAGAMASPRGAGAGGAETSGRGVLTSPSRQPRAAASGPNPRVPALGTIRSASSSKRSLLDAGPPMAVPPITIITPRAEASESDVTTPTDASRTSADGGKPASTPSSGGGLKATSPGVPGAAAATAASRRGVKSASISTARSSRAALAAAAAAAGPMNSPRQRGDAAAASGAGRRGVTGTAAAVDAGAAPPASAPGIRRGVAAGTAAAGATAAPVAGSEAPSSRTRGAVASPMRPSSAAAAAAAAGNTTAAAAAAAARARRSQAGTAGTASAAVGTSKEAPEPATGAASTRPRVRRLSYMTYGSKPAGAEPAGAPASAPLRRVAVGAAAGTGAPTKAAAAAASATSARLVSKEDVAGTFSSHPLSASDVGIDSSCPASASGSSPDLQSGFTPEGAAAAAKAGGAAVAGADMASPYSRADAAAGVAAGPGVAAAGGAHPWGSAPRTRSLISMTTEDSELSIPDGSPLGGPTTGSAAAAAAQPQWNSNELYSGSFGSITTAPSATGVNGASDASGISVSAPDGAADSLLPLGSGSSAAAALAADLPRRVSISAFAPHLAAAAAAAAAATPEGDAGTASESSTTVSSPLEVPAPQPLAGCLSRAAKAQPVMNHLVVQESGRVGGVGAGGAGVAISPTGLQLTSPSPSHESTAATPASAVTFSPRRTPSPSPSKAAVPAAAARRQPGSDSPTRQYNRATGAAAAAGATAASSQQQQAAQRLSSRSPRAQGAAGVSGRAAPSGRGGLTSPLSDSSALSSPATTPRGGRVTPRTAALASGKSGSAAAAAAEAAATAAALDISSPLVPVAEDSGEEAEETTTPRASPASALLDELRASTQALSALSNTAANASTSSGLSESEREQLALLQRVVSLASSLWEAGRDAELGMVLSSTLSRPLERRSTRDVLAPGLATAASAGEAGCADAVAASADGPAAAAAASAVPEWLQPERPQQQPQEESVETGDAVRLTAGPLRGSEAVVRYKGPCHWGTGIVLGLEVRPHQLGAAVTGNESSQQPEDGAAPPAAGEAGMRDGVTYFRCERPGSQAVFVLPDQVVKVA